MKENQITNSSTPWFVAAGVLLALPAGAAHDVFPDVALLPPFLGMLSGLLLGCGLWRTLP